MQLVFSSNRWDIENAPLRKGGVSLRSRWFAIPAILGRDGRASVMRIGLPEPKQRQEIMQCFDLIGELGFQLQCS